MSKTYSSLEISRISALALVRSQDLDTAVFNAPGLSSETTKLLRSSELLAAVGSDLDSAAKVFRSLSSRTLQSVRLLAGVEKRITQLTSLLSQLTAIRSHQSKHSQQKATEVLQVLAGIQSSEWLAGIQTQCSETRPRNTLPPYEAAPALRATTAANQLRELSIQPVLSDDQACEVSALGRVMLEGLLEFGRLKETEARRLVEEDRQLLAQAHGALLSFAGSAETVISETAS